MQSKKGTRPRGGPMRSGRRDDSAEPASKRKRSEGDAKEVGKRPASPSGGAAPRQGGFRPRSGSDGGRAASRGREIERRFDRFEGKPSRGGADRNRTNMGTQPSTKSAPGQPQSPRPEHNRGRMPSPLAPEYPRVSRGPRRESWSNAPGKRMSPMARAKQRQRDRPPARSRGPRGFAPSTEHEVAPRVELDDLDFAIESTGHAPRPSNAGPPSLVCEHFPPCAGCPQIPVPYANQLAAKREEFAAALAPLGVDAAVVQATIPSPLIRGYRNQARLVFRKMSRGGHLHIGLGMYLPGTHRVVHIPNCPIQPERLNAIAAAVVKIAEEMNFSVYDERAGTGVLRYLALRCDRSRKHVLMTLIVGEDNGEPLRILARTVHERYPEVVGALLHVNTRHSNVLFAGTDAWTIGAERLEDEIGRFRVLVSPRSFLQVNHGQAEWIYARLEERLTEGPAEPAATAVTVADPTVPEPPVREIVLDLYCGVGSIALHLARPGRLVIGVEESPEAVEDARRAAHMNRVPGTKFVAARVEDFLREPERFGVDLGAAPVRAAVLNPPRAGCRAGVMEALAALAPKDLAYVSCRPFSLVRDLEVLGGRYAITEATPVDMIPLTTHIESLVFLQRK